MQAGDSPQPMDLAGIAPTCAQERTALTVLAVATLLFCAIAPFATHRMARVIEFIPIYESAMIVNSLVTAALLLGQLQVNRSRPLALLVLGYLFTALISLVHLLAFPGLFAPLGLLGGNEQTSPFLYMCWHGLFPLFVAGYALARPASLAPRALRFGALGVCALVALLVLAATAGARWLPQLLAGSGRGGDYPLGVGTVLLLGVVGLATLMRKRERSLLDLWLTVVMVAWIFDVALSASLNGGRFDLGFYAGRVYGLAASLAVLSALAIENIGVHTRLRATFDEMVEARAREKSSSLLASVLRQLPEGVLILDREQRCVLSNDRANALARALGPGDTALAGQGALLALLAEPLRRAGAGEPFHDEIVESRGDGQRRVYAVRGAPVRDGGGAPAGTVVVVDDITARTEAERALRRSLDQTRYLVENTPLAVIEWDDDFVITLWNARAGQLFGWDASEVVGRRIDSFPIIHEDDVGKVAAVMGRMLDPSTNYILCANRNRTRDGRVIHCEWYNSVLHDEAGRIVTVFSLVLDVTERHQAMEQLQEADRRKDLYIATLAHELRNPLAPIANAASLLRVAQLTPERTTWIADMVARQAAQMSRLLDDLLDVSRIGRGKITLRKEVVDLRRLIRDALQTSNPLIEAARHEVALALPEEAVWVEADALRIVQVLSNLVNNAAKYTSPGGAIRIGLDARDGQAVVSVSDNGVGIEPAMLGRVFEPFVQAGSAVHLAQGGLGIGLSLAKGLVELHGGAIAVASDGPGRGSTFSVTLPLAAQEPRRLEPSAAQPGAALAKSILIADDNADAADSLALLLRSVGARVAVAHDGAAALQAFREQPADIAVLDIGMPLMDGLELASELARCNPRPYLVALTGRGRREDRAASFDAGFDEHLTKPVAPQELIALLQKV